MLEHASPQSVPPTDRASAAARTLLVFTVAQQRYALGADDVVEILRAVAIARLPSAPPAVEGLVNVRGALVAVLDVRVRFGLPAKPVEPSDRFVLARSRGRVVALRVDEVHELAEVPVADLDSTRDVVPAAAHVAGVAKLPDGLVYLYDLPAFLSHADFVALDAAVGAGGAT